jgi:hypothetical protein
LTCIATPTSSHRQHRALDAAMVVAAVVGARHDEQHRPGHQQIVEDRRLAALAVAEVEHEDIEQGCDQRATAPAGPLGQRRISTAVPTTAASAIAW